MKYLLTVESLLLRMSDRLGADNVFSHRIASVESGERFVPHMSLIIGITKKYFFEQGITEKSIPR